MNPPSVHLRAPAKVNWRLEVLHRRPDRFHELSLVFQAVSLHDEIMLRAADAVTLRLAEGPEDLETGDGNLMVQAARAYLRAARVPGGAAMTLVKRIPVAAGLGGGSSDAAAVLLGMNRLHGDRLSSEELAEVAATLGSDVPYFLVGGCAHGKGRGEVLERWEVRVGVPLVLVKPEGGLSTGKVYASEAVVRRARPAALAGMRRALAAGDGRETARWLFNSLEPAALSLCPEIGEIQEELREAGALGALVSGSGPTVFGLFEDRRSAEGAVRRLSGGERFVAAVETLGTGVEIL